MNIETSSIEKNLKILHEKVVQALYSAQRKEGSVRIIAVTKYQPIQVFTHLSSLGLHEIGESRVQDALKRKKEVLHMHTGPYTWHMIGPLQKNKVAKALQCFDYIHSVDSLELAQAISKQAEKRIDASSPVRIFLQVNPLQEATKQGFAIDDLSPSKELVYTLRSLPHLEIVGLMAMAPQRKIHGIKAVEDTFSTTERLFRDLQSTVFSSNPAFCELSMGMSDDFEIAIHYGATYIRVGSSLFQGIYP